MSEAGRPQHPPDEALVDLVHGSASAEERSSIVEHLRGCRDCEQRFVEAWRDREIARATAPASAAIPGSRRARTLVIAAIAATIFLAALLIPVRRPALLAPDWLSFDATDSLARGDGPCALAPEAVRAYRAHDAARVVLLLGGKDLPAACDPLRLLLASALLHVDEPARALQVLEALDVESIPQPARDRGRWVRALALDRLERRDESLEVLRNLAARPGEFQERASEVVRARK